MPVSRTVTRTRSGRGVETVNVTLPAGRLYLIAFDPKFMRICANRVRSAATIGSSGGNASSSTRMPWPAAIGSSVLPHLVEHLDDAHRLGGDRHAPGLDARQVQDVVDEAQEVLAPLEDLIDALLVPLRERLLLVSLKELREARGSR